LYYLFIMVHRIQTKKQHQRTRLQKVKSSVTSRNSKNQSRKNSKKATRDVKYFEKEIQRVMNVKKGANNIERAQIEMNDSQKTHVYLMLLQLMLMGANETAKKYAKMGKYDYDKLRREAIGKAESKSELLKARTVGSRRVKSATPLRVKSLTTPGRVSEGLKKANSMVKEQLRGHLDYYKNTKPGMADYVSGVKMPKL
jgi:hypothetical protein